MALEWLRTTILEQKAEVLIVAGDIFDQSNPPHPARRLYYDFLTALRETPCRTVVIVAGNHDSPALLEAPKALLRHLNIFVVGSPAADPTEDLVPLVDAQGQPAGAIAAVPFLRDRDLGYSQAGETATQRIERIQAALQAHFWGVGAAVEPLVDANQPLLVTAHLYAQGASAAEGQKNIYIGDTENLRIDDLHPRIDYLALGHVHRPQSLHPTRQARYSGSLIPLSFSETMDEKGVVLLEWTERADLRASFLPAPTFRRLKTISGSPAAVKERMQRFAAKPRPGLTPWLELLLESSGSGAGLVSDFKNLAQDLNIEVLKIRLLSTTSPNPGEPTAALPALEDLTAVEVFRQKCQSAGVAETEWPELMASFLELLNWMDQPAALAKDRP